MWVHACLGFGQWGTAFAVCYYSSPSGAGPRAPSPTGEGTLQQPLRVEVRTILDALQVQMRLAACLGGDAPRLAD